MLPNSLKSGRERPNDCVELNGSTEGEPGLNAGSEGCRDVGTVEVDNSADDCIAESNVRSDESLEDDCLGGELEKGDCIDSADISGRLRELPEPKSPPGW